MWDFCFWALVWLLLGLGPVAPSRAAKATIGGPRSPDGKVEVTCDLPVEMRHLNRGGSNGAGLCVFASIDHAALYQNDDKVIGLFQKMFKEPGGGWPAKVKAMMAKYCPGAQYVQYEGKDPAILDLALKTGRMPAVIYGGDHMVSLVYLDATWACCLDNNYIGENQLRWFKRDEFVNRVWRGGGNGWAVVLLHPRPPAPPHNGGPKMFRSIMVASVVCLAGVGSGLGGASVGEDREGPLLPRTNGVVRSQCCDCDERCEVNGCPCTRAEMMKAMRGADVLTDDSAWLSLSLIGSQAETGKVRADLESAASTRDSMKRLLVQEFRPGNPLVAKCGFVTTGHPTIYLQRPDGEVLCRVDAYPGADAMAGTLQSALAVQAEDCDGCRKPQPAYQPAADPGAVLPVKPQVNAEVTPAPWMLVLSHAATLVVGGLGALGGRWAVVSMLIEPALQALESRLAAKDAPATTAAAPAAGS